MSQPALVEDERQRKERILIYNNCPFLQCKCIHRGRFQAASMKPLNMGEEEKCSVTTSPRSVPASFRCRDDARWEQVGLEAIRSTPPPGLPWWSSGEEAACPCRGRGFDPWSWKIPCASEHPLVLPLLSQGSRFCAPQLAKPPPEETHIPHRESTQPHLEKAWVQPNMNKGKRL